MQAGSPAFCAQILVMARTLLAVLLLSICGTRADAIDRASQAVFEFSGIERSYSSFVPQSVDPAGAPLLVLLHGSFSNGAAIVGAWIALAQEEGMILAGPDAREREAWQLRADGPQFIRALIDDVASKHAIDRSRIYLFGNSGGAVYSLTLSMLESQLFAATAVHAGAWREPNEFRAARHARRKIAIAIFIGDRDRFFPLFAARKTQSALEHAGHAVQVTVIPGHTHAYAEVAAEVNRDAWQFMKAHHL
jgi:poly(3-hydroxybutyrate) depolymerase